MFALLRYILFGSFLCCFTNILEFAIEDYFTLPLLDTMLGTEYARSCACMLGIFIFYLICGFLYTKYCKKLYINKQNTKITTLVYIGLILVSFVSLFYVCKVLYIFLSGASDFAGIIRGLLSISILLLGLILLYVDMKAEQSETNNCFIIKHILLFVMSLFAVAGILITLKFASPYNLKIITRDILAIEKLDTKVNQYTRYYENNNKLPHNVINESSDTKILKICIKLSGDWQYARRINYYHHGTYTSSHEKNIYKIIINNKGTYCSINKLHCVSPRPKAVISLENTIINNHYTQ